MNHSLFGAHAIALLNIEKEHAALVLHLSHYINGLQLLYLEDRTYAWFMFIYLAPSKEPRTEWAANIVCCVSENTAKDTPPKKKYFFFFKKPDLI